MSNPCQSTDEFEQYDLAETYVAQMESAMRAGWADPIMDEYNDYDQHHKEEPTEFS